MSDPKKTGDQRDILRLCQAFGGIAASLVVIVVLLAFANVTTLAAGLSFNGAALLVVGVSALSGGLLGFLFAIPRSRQRDSAAPSPANDTRQSDGSTEQSDYLANTNLEQISDWLTKIIVGATLVQLGPLATKIHELAVFLAPTFGLPQSQMPMATALALCLIGFGSLWGFFFVYLFSRLWLPRALSRAEKEEAIGKRQVEREFELQALQSSAYDALFREPPEGYEGAIRAIEAYQNSPGALPSAWLNMYLACAYGQRHAYEKPVKGSDADSMLRERVRSAANRAIQLNSGVRSILIQTYKGENSGEDDLASLNPDEALEQIIGVSTEKN